MPKNQVNLIDIFQNVTQALAQNQQTLDQQDEYNHDHGTNMVQTFQTITNSLQQKQGKSASSALSYAAKEVTRNSTSSSGQLYAQGLSQAAANFKGKKVDSRGALDLLQTLIGGGQSSQTTSPSGGGDIMSALLGQLAGGAQPQPSGAAQSGDDLLGALMGQMQGGGQSQPSQASQPGGDGLADLLGQMTTGTPSQATPAPQAGGDLLSSLLGSLGGRQASGSGTGSGFDLGDLVNAGMSYMQAKQQGGSTAQALIQAFMTASGMGNSAHRTQSTALVINSFLQALASSQKSR